MSILTINAPNTLDKMIELTKLTASPFDGKKWYIEIVPCSEPTCACKNVTLLFRDEHQINTNEYAFYAEGDLAAERFTKLDFSNPENDRTIPPNAPLFLEEILSEEDWKNLVTVHNVAKGAFIEDCNLKKVEANFSVNQLKDPSSVVLFREIFPYASYFFFDEEANIPYMVYDQYCSNHKCNCTYVVLSFTADGGNEDFAFRYNYKTNEIELLDGWEKEVPFSEANNYVQLLKEKYIDFDKKLKERNEIMRYLFKKFTIRMNTQLVRAKKSGEKKIGRNAPCPCGSGKKYKRCCG